ncbi:putative DNA helicase [Cotonvirus japonicus]|uniref:DNA helicase n=1 Tax=Cotonvirus japonicus TaxID=2811091 RepID=A0ABM7NT26_9VIRU|nr:putative DNA helicase [Cotonvirus japonicus]BCS83330.1 putative DNA helicase [Cotonvirus japonicus]
MLNVKQQLTADKLEKFIKQNLHKIFYLIGYAGTGKTFIVSRFTKDLLLSNKLDNIYYCAPTHKALNVLQSYIRSNLTQSESDVLSDKIRFMTIHKLLEFKPVIQTDTGSKIFKSTKESKFLKKINNILVVVDECSMIPKEMVDELERYSDLYPIKFLFLGDPKQLPPVGEPESLIFSKIPINYEYHIVLDEIMRTKSPDIKDVCSLIRNWNTTENINKPLLEIYKRSKIKKFRLYHKRENDTESSWFKNFIKEVNENNIPIILTWKNSTSEYYNNIIRQFIHKSTNLSDYMENDYLIFNNFYVSEENCESFYTSDMVKIISVNVSEKILFDWLTLLVSQPKTDVDRGFNSLIKKLSKQKNKFKINILHIKRIQSDVIGVHTDDINIIYTVSITDLLSYKDTLKNIKEHIEFFYKKYRSEKYTTKLWDIFHKKLIEPFAEINFGFSITTHKSQGSTYNSVYVDVQDICSNTNSLEMQKSLYTAAGRSANKLGFMIE